MVQAVTSSEPFADYASAVLDTLTTATNVLVTSLLKPRITGSQLKKWRKSLDLTQDEFADRLGVTRRTIGRAEKKPTKRVSRVLGGIIGLTVKVGDLPAPPKE